MLEFIESAKQLFPAELRPGRLVARFIMARTAGRVLDGPFRGMEFASRSVWGAHSPKLLGTYESELHGILDELPNLPVDHVVDIGGAEGYYAVGLALFLSEAPVTVFEMLPEGRESIRALAERNAVAARLKIVGACAPESLREVLDPVSKPFILCDVEGYERELLVPSLVPQLRRAYMLVEVHDHKAAGAGEALRRRFAESHSVEVIEQSPRTQGDYPWIRLVGLTPLAQRYALNEFRNPRTYWMWFEPTGNAK